MRMTRRVVTSMLMLIVRSVMTMMLNGGGLLGDEGVGGDWM